MSGHGPVRERIAACGPFFAFEVHDEGSAPPAPWRPLSGLVEDRAVLRERVEQVRSGLAASGGSAARDVETRVAASVMHLGLAARLLSPQLAVAVLCDDVMRIDPRSAWWQPGPGSLIPLSLAGPLPELVAPGAPTAPWRPAASTLAPRLTDALLDGPVRHLGEALADLSVSPPILRGNLASAIHGAARSIAFAVPAWGPRAHALARAVLAQPALRDASMWTADGRFRRRSCCLIYRAASPGSGALCGDCVLTHVPPAATPRR